MKIHLLVLILCICSIQTFYSQEDDGVVSLAIPTRNSLTFNRYNLNPTFSFVREQTKYLSFYNKREWVQFEDAPLTYLVSYSGRFGENIGAGVGLFQQNYGVLTTFGGILNFAYNARLGRDSNLTFGLNVGAYKSGVNTSNVITNFSDPSLQNVPENFLLTINPGINYGTEFLDFGLSVSNLALYNFNTSELIQDNPEQSIQVHVMYTGYMASRGFFDEGKFSGLIRSEFQQDETIISGVAMVTVPKGIWAQVGYNTRFGASGGVGLNLTQQIAIEYNFETAMGDLQRFGPSHEFTLAYRFKNNKFYDYSREDEVSGILSGGNKRRRVSKTSKPKTTTSKLAQERRAQSQADEKAKLLAEQKAKKEAEAKALALALAEQKAKEENEAKLIAEQKAANDAEEQAKLAATQEAQKEADRKAEEIAETRARLLAEQKAKEEAEAQAKLLEQQKAEAEAQAILLAEQKAKEEAEAQAKLLEQQKAEAEAQAILLAEQKAKEEAEAQTKLLEQQKAEAEAQAIILAEQKAKEEAEAQAKLLEQQKVEAEAQAILLAEQKAKEEAEAQAELLAEQQEKEDLISNPQDELGKSMKALTEQTEESKATQNLLLEQLDDIIAIKDQDLKDLKEENDLSDQGITVKPRPFKSVTEENNRLNSIKSDLDNIIKTRSEEIEELKMLYEQRTEGQNTDLDEVNLFYDKKIKRLTEEQLKAVEARAQLDSKLESIRIATEFEKRRRIKRAAYDNEEDRYAQDRAALKNIKQATSLSEKPLNIDDFDFGEDQGNSIKILKNIKNIESGYYVVIAVHSDVEKRNEFVTKVVASGRNDVDFFYNVNTSEYYIYYDKFETIEDANQALKSKGNRPYNAKMSLVKIEN
jgi:type IX secretion system PorP/SprF family membrane protein